MRTSRTIAGFTSSTPVALAHILTGIHVDPQYAYRYRQNAGLIQINPSSTHTCSVIDEANLSLATSVVPAGGLLDINYFTNATDEVMLAAAITPSATTAVNAYLAERERVLALLRDEGVRQEAEAAAASERERHGVTLVKFPNALTPLRDGPPGASYHRIPVEDLMQLASIVHDKKDVQAGCSLCIRLARVRYEVLLDALEGMPACGCNACVKVRCIDWSHRIGLMSLAYRVSDL